MKTKILQFNAEILSLGGDLATLAMNVQVSFHLIYIYINFWLGISRFG